MFIVCILQICWSLHFKLRYFCCIPRLWPCSSHLSTITVHKCWHVKSNWCKCRRMKDKSFTWFVHWIVYNKQVHASDVLFLTHRNRKLFLWLCLKSHLCSRQKKGEKYLNDWLTAFVNGREETQLMLVGHMTMFQQCWVVADYM